MLPFGVGEYIAGMMMPHLVYARRQGVNLAVAFVFGVATVLFLLLTLFFTLTWVMQPVFAALLLALLCGSVAGVMVLIMSRRAKARGKTAEDKAMEGVENAEAAVGSMLALRGLAIAAVPTLALGAIGAIAYFATRKSGD